MTDPRIQAALETAIERGEVGVQVAAYLGERLIIDASIGVADEDTGRPAADAIYPIFSTSKAVTATAIHMQAERGLLDVDAPVAEYWPEYAVNGKQDITIRHVLTHRAGVPHMPPEATPDDVLDFDWVIERIEKVAPVSTPGEKSIYHSMSFGYILGEVLRRTDPKHRLPCAFFREEIFDVVGADDFYIGLPPALEPRVAKLTWGANPPKAPQVARNELRALMMPIGLNATPDVFNLPQIHQSCMPAGSGITSALSGARFFSLLANGGKLTGKRLLSEARLRACLELRENPLQVDDGLSMSTWIGVGGYWLGGEHPPADPVQGNSRTILSHGGAGGTLGWADLDTGLAVMITHNRLFGAVSYEQHPFVPLGQAIREVVADLVPA